MKDRCSKCGKKARMSCPALEAPLCSSCCGRGRGVSINCTADCTANPFGKASYDRFREIDTALTNKLFKAMAQDGYHFPRMLSESKRFQLTADEGDDPIETGAFSVIQDWIFYQRDANNQTRFQRWEDAGWPGFTNDEQQLLHMRQNTELTLMELVSVEGDFQTRVRDLLDPSGREHTIFDYSLVKHFLNYQVLFGCLTPLRHYSRIEANGATVDPSHADDLLAFIREKSGTADASAQKAWLRLHAPEVATENERLQKVARERRISPADSIFSQTIYYSDRTPDAWVEFLGTHAEFDEYLDFHAEDALDRYGPIHHCFHWLRWAGASDAPQTSFQTTRIDARDEVQVLASVDIYENHIALSGLNQDLMNWLRDRWSTHIAPGLIVESESDRDLKNRKLSAVRQPVGSRPQTPSPPSPRLLDDRDDSEIDDELKTYSPEVVAAITRKEQQHFRQLLDESIPALKGMTPREASKSRDPQARKLLEQWAKSTIHGHSRRRAKQGNLPNLFWFYQKLNLPHLWPSDWPKGSD